MLITLPVIGRDSERVITCIMTSSDGANICIYLPEALHISVEGLKKIGVNGLTIYIIYTISINSYLSASVSCGLTSRDMRFPLKIIPFHSICTIVLFQSSGKMKLSVENLIFPGPNSGSSKETSVFTALSSSLMPALPSVDANFNRLVIGGIGSRSEERRVGKEC